MTATTLPGAPLNVMDEWVARYAPNPALFVREVLGEQPDPWQIDGLEAYRRAALRGAPIKHRQISIRSGHRPGKTTLLAWITLHHLLFFVTTRILATAPTEAQLYNAYYPEVKMWFGKLPPPVKGLYDVKSESIELKAAPAEVFLALRTARPETPEALAGVHSDWPLVIVDEGSGVHDKVYETLFGSMAASQAIMIIAGNPVRSTGHFYETHNKLKAQWTTFHVPSWLSPRVSKEWVEQMRIKYGEHSNAYRVRVEGNFPRADDDTIIPRELIEAATMRDVQPTRTGMVWGVDVAYMGSDRSTLVKRNGNTVPERPKWVRGYETMQVVGWIKAEWDASPQTDRPVDIVIDSIGYGAGVASRLRELGLPIIALNVAESPAVKGNYPNLRTELYFDAAAWFRARDCKLPSMLQGTDETMDDLIEELSGQTYEPPSSTGRTAATAKKMMKKKLGRSPDLGDAFTYTFASNAGKAMFGRMGRPGEPLKRELHIP